MWVGRRLRRFEDPALLRGQGRFVADYVNPQTKVVRFVRSPVARGRILGVEVPDGATVITGEDLAHLPPIRPLLHREDYVPIPQNLLAREVVRYAGEPIAAVVADNASEAEDLAEKVYVDIEPMAPVIGIDAALSPNALPVHPELFENTVVDANSRRRISTPDGMRPPDL